MMFVCFMDSATSFAHTYGVHSLVSPRSHLSIVQDHFAVVHEGFWVFDQNLQQPLRRDSMSLSEAQNKDASKERAMNEEGGEEEGGGTSKIERTIYYYFLNLPIS